MAGALSATARIFRPLVMRALWPAWLLPCGLLLLAGCGSAPSIATKPTPPVARLTLTNLTGHAWRVVVQSTSGAERHALQLAAHETLSVACSGGDYAVEQMRLAADHAMADVRRASIRLEPGEAYEWPLATVLSVAGSAQP